MKTKNEMRLISFSKKQTVDLKKISGIIEGKILNLREYEESNIIMLYSALSDEISLDFVLEESVKLGKCCCFPVIEGNDIIIRKYTEAGFVSGKFGINEPIGEIVSPRDMDMIVVPGLMFDIACRRLGRGGGFYDRLLPNTSAFKVGICADSLLIDNVPIQPHDMAVDMVLTEKRMILNGR